jgi:hypothetical protein
MSDLFDEVVAMRQRGEVRCDLHKAAQAGLASGQISSALWGPVAQALGKQMAGELVAPSSMRWWSPIMRPLAAVGLTAGAYGASRAYAAAQTAGVEDEVVKRFKMDFVAGGRRNEDDWSASGQEQKVRTAYRDLKALAPDMAAILPVAVSTVRKAMLRDVPEFSMDEVKSITDAQKASRDTHPLGTHALKAVETLFKILPEATSAY